MKAGGALLDLQVADNWPAAANATTNMAVYIAVYID
jgi:hypothetical protein